MALGGRDDEKLQPIGIKKTIKVKQPATFFHSDMIAKLEMTLNNAQQKRTKHKHPQTLGAISRISWQILAFIVINKKVMFSHNSANIRMLKYSFLFVGLQ